MTRSTNNCGDEGGRWMEWLEQGMEFFGCDENATVSSSSPKRLTSGNEYDYAKRHDDLLESLLHEQTQKDDDTSSAPSLSSSSITSSSSRITEESSQPKGPTRPLKLHRRVAPARNSPRLPKTDAVTVSFAAISQADLPPPPTFLHSHCILQKDKGKGDPVGSNICAKGRDLCLFKLRQKMDLLTNFCQERGKNGTMKRRKARVSEICRSYTETRSLIELRMGFVSVQYGVLLRWESGLVNLVVLRKMCHDSFYPATSLVTQQRLPEFKPAPFKVSNVVNGKHALFQRPGGMEVTLLEPPYRVTRPDVFAPSILAVSILHAQGLSHKLGWTVQLDLASRSESTSLRWSPEQRQHVAKTDNSIEWEMTPSLSLDLGSLQVRLLSHRHGRQGRTKLVCSRQIPLSGLQARPAKDPSPKQLTLSLNGQASLTLSFSLTSDYGHWLEAEVEARRREEVAGFSWKAPFYRVEPPEISLRDDPWEWVCGVC